MNDTLDSIESQLAGYIAQVRADASDGLTWAEFGRMYTGLVAFLSKSLDAVNGMPGPEKHRFVVSAVGRLFDATADFIVTGWTAPLWMMCRGHVRKLFLALGSGAIETLLPIVRKTTP